MNAPLLQAGIIAARYSGRSIGEMTVEERARVITEAQERQRLARLENTEAPAVLHHKRLSHARMDNWSVGDWQAHAVRSTRQSP